MIDPQNAIEVRQVSKFFKVYKDGSHMLREKLLHLSRNRYEKREVLHDISFSIRKGETVGLIGENGCGKSTMLKMITKILQPNQGTIETAGKVYSMIELGAGFHPDMTGRENIYINASIFGIRRKEVDRRMNDIIHFSELEEFIDSPVRTYSSGMYLRLAFAVAINVDADILLIDEILAVGDQNFQRKCLNKLKELQDSGITIVLVSHSMEQVKEFCSRTIWLEQGSVREDGPADKVCEDYLRAEAVKGKERQIKEMENVFGKTDWFARIRQTIPQCSPSVETGGAGGAAFRSVYMETQDRPAEKLVYRIGDPMRIHLEAEAESEHDLIVTIDVIRKDWLYCYGISTLRSYRGPLHAEKELVLDAEIASLSLLPGTYHINLYLKNQDETPLQFFNNCIEFTVAPRKEEDEIGVFSMEHSWTFRAPEGKERT